MKKLESLKTKLFEKEINLKRMGSITGGYTGTGCQHSLSTNGEEYECSDTDQDKPTQQSLSAL
ncbi:hypothetical protein [uncultured Chryseobacterium sp.]|uniref:hypothetical protein n=1 Tax=uncultured Chryseobacterium sp. TaxID=259322 RepID=UPI003748D9DB